MVKRQWIHGGLYHVRAVAGGFVRHNRRGLAGQGRGGAAGGVDAFLFLPAVAEPNTNHFLLHVELLRHEQDLLRGRLLVLRRKTSQHQTQFQSFQILATN